MSIFWPPSMWASFPSLGNLPLYWSQLEVECISQMPWIPTFFQTLSNWQRPKLISTDGHHGPQCLECYTKGRDRGQHLPEAEEVLAFDFRSPEVYISGSRVSWWSQASITSCCDSTVLPTCVLPKFSPAPISLLRNGLCPFSKPAFTDLWLNWQFKMHCPNKLLFYLSYPVRLCCFQPRTLTVTVRVDGVCERLIRTLIAFFKAISLLIFIF